MGGSNDVAVREADWESMGHWNFVWCTEWWGPEIASVPRVNDGSVVAGGAVGGN